MWAKRNLGINTHS